jgi:serine/threonine-protein kinase RsbW
MSDRPDVALTMPARPEGVGVVRQALAGMADALAIEADVLADMKMAVTEACTNVVVHAYAGAPEPGLLDVGLLADDDSLTVIVADDGSGIQPRAACDGTPALGLGLPLIAALSDAFELRGATRGGTEVRMTFLYARDRDPVEANPIGKTGWEPPEEAQRLPH